MERRELGLAWEAHLSENRAYYFSEPLESLLRFPDIHDAKAVVGWTGSVREDPAARPVTK
jgi:hypothetical protein